MAGRLHGGLEPSKTAGRAPSPTAERAAGAGETGPRPPEELGRPQLLAILAGGCLLACVAMLLVSLWLINRQATEMLYQQSVVQQQFLMKLMEVQDDVDALKRRLGDEGGP